MTTVALPAHVYPVVPGEREDALSRSGLLKYTTDERLQNLVYTAGRYLGVYACFVNLLGDEYQIHAAAWPEALVHTKMLLEDSACRTVVEAQERVVIPDTDLDPRMSWRGPFTPEGGMRSYLGVPVWDGVAVAGTFCVVDDKPRDWGFFEVSSLEGLARLAGLSVRT